MDYLSEEISHIHQWEELQNRAKNFGLDITYDSTAFYLHRKHVLVGSRENKQLGKYLTLADLRAGISDYVAGERSSGRMMT